MTAILVAENDPGICDLLTDVLGVELAAVVQCAKTGALAAHAIDTQAFDLAIVDVGMPEISGYELAQRAANRNIPALLCSGHPDTLITLKEHDCPHLAKPFRMDELVYEAAKVITHAQKNIRRVKSSLTKLQATIQRLAKDMAASQRLINESKALLADRNIKP